VAPAAAGRRTAPRLGIVHARPRPHIPAARRAAHTAGPGSLALPEFTIAEPSWLLLIWSGLAATLAASVVGAGPGILIGTRIPRRHRLRRHLGRLLLGAALGVIVYPVLYGVAFEWMVRADLVIGAMLGAAHGALAILARAVRPPTHRGAPGPGRLLAGHLVYGALLGWLYVVPPT
jgi:hypothetical protein